MDYAAQFEIFLQRMYDHLKLRYYGVRIQILNKNNLFFYEYLTTVMQKMKNKESFEGNLKNINKTLIIHINADIKIKINCVLE